MVIPVPATLIELPSGILSDQVSGVIAQFDQRFCGLPRIVRRQNLWDKRGEKRVETFPPFRYAILYTK